MKKHIDTHGISVSQVAKSFSLGRNRLFSILRKAGALMSEGDRKNEPYQKFIDDNTFIVKLRQKEVNGELRSFSTTFVTTSGVNRIRSYLLAKGIIKDYKRHNAIMVLLRHGDLPPVIYDFGDSKGELADRAGKIRVPGCTAMVFSEEEFLACKEEKLKPLVREYASTRFATVKKAKRKQSDPSQGSLF